MAINEIGTKYFLGAEINEKITKAKINEIILALNNLTDGSISTTTLTVTDDIISTNGDITSGGALVATGSISTSGGDIVCSTGSVKTDTINEVTAATGVTVDGVLLKDSSIALADGLVTNLALKLGADQNNGIYGISDTQMGFAVEGALVGGFDTTGVFTGTISEQVATAGVTIDGLLVKDGSISSNSMYGGFFPITAAQALSGAGAVNVTSYLTKYTSTGVADALTLASGTQIGQRKKVSHVVDGGSGVLTAVFVGGTTITFTTVGEFADLLWTGSSWAVLELGNTATPGTPPVLA